MLEKENMGFYYEESSQAGFENSPYKEPAF